MIGHRSDYGHIESVIHLLFWSNCTFVILGLEFSSKRHATYGAIQTNTTGVSQALDKRREYTGIESAPVFVQLVSVEVGCRSRKFG